MTATMLIGSTSLSALIVSSTGDVNVVTPVPGTDINNDYENSTEVTVFDELQDVTLNRVLSIDAAIPAPGSALTYDDAGDFSSSTIAVGEVVSSHYLFNETISGGPFNYTGSITFSDEIIGVQVFANTVDDPFISQVDLTSVVSGIDYGYSALTDMAFSGGQADEFTISGDRKTFTFDFNTSNLDMAVRIFTQESTATAVPEPETYLIIGSTLLICYFGIRRRALAKLQKSP